MSWRKWKTHRKSSEGIRILENKTGKGKRRKKGFALESRWRVMVEVWGGVVKAEGRIRINPPPHSLPRTSSVLLSLSFLLTRNKPPTASGMGKPWILIISILPSSVLQKCTLSLSLSLSQLFLDYHAWINPLGKIQRVQENDQHTHRHNNVYFHYLYVKL